VLRRVIFISQSRAEGMRGRPSRALISITAPSQPPAALQDNWHSVFRIAFDDADLVRFPDDDPGVRPLTVAQAASMAEFVLGLPPAVGTLVVHCKFGVSRSGAVAKAVAQCMRLPFPDYNEHNRFVFDLVAGEILAKTHPLDNA